MAQYGLKTETTEHLAGMTVGGGTGSTDNVIFVELTSGEDVGINGGALLFSHDRVAYIATSLVISDDASYTSLILPIECLSLAVLASSEDELNDSVVAIINAFDLDATTADMLYKVMNDSLFCSLSDVILCTNGPLYSELMTADAVIAITIVSGLIDVIQKESGKESLIAEMERIYESWDECIPSVWEAASEVQNFEDISFLARTYDKDKVKQLIGWLIQKVKNYNEYSTYSLRRARVGIPPILSAMRERFNEQHGEMFEKIRAKVLQK